MKFDTGCILETILSFLKGLNLVGLQGSCYLIEMLVRPKSNQPTDVKLITHKG